MQRELPFECMSFHLVKYSHSSGSSEVSTSATTLTFFYHPIILFLVFCTSRGLWGLKRFFGRQLLDISCSKNKRDLLMSCRMSGTSIGKLERVLRQKKNRPVLNKAVLLEISRKCFLVSTAEDLNSSQKELMGRDKASQVLTGEFLNCHMCQFLKIRP